MPHVFTLLKRWRTHSQRRELKHLRQLLWRAVWCSIRLPTLYSTDDRSRQGYFFHVGGKKIKNKNSWPADVGGKKKIKGINWQIHLLFPLKLNQDSSMSEEKSWNGYFFFLSDTIPAHRRARHPQNKVRAALLMMFHQWYGYPCNPGSYLTWQLNAINIKHDPPSCCDSHLMTCCFLSDRMCVGDSPLPMYLSDHQIWYHLSASSWQKAYLEVCWI